MWDKLQKTPGLRLVVAAAIAFFLLTLFLTLHRHYSFYSSYDQGIFNQVFWNNLHGRFFQSSLSSQLSTNVVHNDELPTVYYHRLGQHFTPALLTWLPIYALFPNPATLTVLQVIFVTAAGLVLYALARQYLAPNLAGLITISFYCANAILGPTLANFHDLSQIPLFFFTLLLAMEKRWWWLFAIFAILILAVREDSAVILFGIGVYMVVSKRFPRLGLAVCTLSFSYILFLTNLIMPLFSDDISQRFMLEKFGQYVEGDEASTLEIIGGMISQPWLLLVELVTPVDRTFNYLLGHWLPLAFIPAIAPNAWIIAGFPLMKLFLAKGQSVLAINIRYAMTVVPGLFYGTIIWWSKHSNLGKKSLFRRFWSFCLCLSLIFTFTSSTSALNRAFYFLLPDSFEPWVYISLPKQWHHVKKMRPLLAKIPAEASVSATTYIIPHLSSRREILRLPLLALRNDNRKITKVDYLIADLWRLREYQPAFNQEWEELRDLTNLIDSVTKQEEYGIINFQDGVILLQKNIKSNPEATAAWLKFRQQIQPILQQSRH
ncbi:MAG: DUF2079 domain-containing protein [Oscillatoria sp. PMC 1051.18]|nr:DUF2079 domain-containing protein [Oscillatoria sp. PMC 1050.18]MEC5029061.1 DUF2079 domain-containing protein [Oscillatoria sp. PMC 1051.18]